MYKQRPCLILYIFVSFTANFNCFYLPSCLKLAVGEHFQCHYGCEFSFSAVLKLFYVILPLLVSVLLCCYLSMVSFDRNKFIQRSIQMATHPFSFSPQKQQPRNQNPIAFRSPPFQQPQSRGNHNPEIDINSMRNRLDALVRQAESYVPQDRRAQANSFNGPQMQLPRGQPNPQQAPPPQQHRPIRMDNRSLNNIKPQSVQPNLSLRRQQQISVNSSIAFQQPQREVFRPNSPDPNIPQRFQFQNNTHQSFRPHSPQIHMNNNVQFPNRSQNSFRPISPDRNFEHKEYQRSAVNQSNMQSIAERPQQVSSSRVQQQSFRNNTNQESFEAQTKQMPIKKLIQQPRTELNQQKRTEFKRDEFKRDEFKLDTKIEPKIENKVQENKVENWREYKFQKSAESKFEMKAEPKREQQNYQPKAQPKREEKKDEGEISWTKYLSMEFKYEEVQKQVVRNKESLKREKQKVDNLQEQLVNIKEENQKRVSVISQQYMEQIAEQKAEYEKQLQQKNEHIKELVEKFSGHGKGSQDPVVQSYINEALQQNERLIEQIKQSEIREQDLQIKWENSEKAVKFLKEEAQAYKRQIDTVKSEFKSIENMLSNKNSPFEEVIKSQLEESRSVRERLEILQEENQRLRQSIQDLDRQISNNKADQAAIELREKCLRNKLVAETGITLSNKDNAIQTLTRKMQTLEEKYKMAVAEIKAKDQFLKQYLVGRTDEIDVKEHISKVLSQFEGQFGNFSQEQKYIQEIEKLKGKINMYERNY